MALRAIAAIVLLCASALPSAAQQPVKLRFSDGRVTLVASNTPVRTILAEWARLGGATVVNGERVAGPPVTLELTNVSERQALDIVLRGVAGYMLAPRRAGSAGVSTFDRIVILPTSTAPRNPPPTVAATAGPRPILPRPAIIARPPEPALDTPPDAAIEEVPVEEEPAVNMPAVISPVPRVAPPVVVRPGVETEDEVQSDGAEEPDTAAAPTPANPFGVPAGSSATPGVISPAPKPQQRPLNRVQ